MKFKWEVVREARDLVQGEWHVSKTVTQFDTEEAAHEYLKTQREIYASVPQYKFFEPRKVVSMSPIDEHQLGNPVQQMHIADTLDVSAHYYRHAFSEHDLKLINQLLDVVKKNPTRDPVLNVGDLRFVQGMLYANDAITQHELFILNNSMRRTT